MKTFFTYYNLLYGAEFKLNKSRIILKKINLQITPAIWINVIMAKKASILIQMYYFDLFN